LVWPAQSERRASSSPSYHGDLTGCTIDRVATMQDRAETTIQSTVNTEMLGERVSVSAVTSYLPPGHGMPFGQRTISPGRAIFPSRLPPRSPVRRSVTDDQELRLPTRMGARRRRRWANDNFVDSVVPISAEAEDASSQSTERPFFLRGARFSCCHWLAQADMRQQTPPPHSPHSGKEREIRESRRAGRPDEMHGRASRMWRRVGRCERSLLMAYATHPQIARTQTSIQSYLRDASAALGRSLREAEEEDGGCEGGWLVVSFDEVDGVVAVQSEQERAPSSTLPPLLLELSHADGGPRNRSESSLRAVQRACCAFYGLRHHTVERCVGGADGEARRHVAASLNPTPSTRDQMQEAAARKKRQTTIARLHLDGQISLGAFLAQKGGRSEDRDARVGSKSRQTDTTPRRRLDLEPDGSEG